MDYSTSKGMDLRFDNSFVRELPEAMKPRTIPIATKADKPRVIDSKAA
mgnify:CR=1 FL=1